MSRFIIAPLPGVRHIPIVFWCQLTLERQISSRLASSSTSCRLVEQKRLRKSQDDSPNNDLESKKHQHQDSVLAGQSVLASIRSLKYCVFGHMVCRFPFNRYTIIRSIWINKVYQFMYLLSLILFHFFLLVGSRNPLRQNGFERMCVFFELTFFYCFWRFSSCFHLAQFMEDFKIPRQ